MKYYRITSTGRRISAEARVRSEPDRERLVTLVLHIADELHAHELDERQRRIGTPPDHEESTPAPSLADQQGDDDDTDSSTSTRDRGASVV